MTSLLHQLVANIRARIGLSQIDRDDVFPVYDLDEVLGCFVVNWTLRFDDVLDASQLHSALTRLLEIGSWRKLGGRLKRNKEGKLEIHVPQRFTTERPAVRFSHSVFPYRIDEHPLSRQLPKVTEGPSIQRTEDSIVALSIPSNVLKTTQDYICADEPQLGLHVTSFDDATLVTLMLPHTMTDAMGMSEIVKGMSLVLSGRESDVPELLGAATDVLGDISTLTDAKEPQILKSMRMGILKRIRYIFKLLYELIWKDRVESNVLFLPAEFMAHIRRKAEAALAGDTKTAHFITDGDIISAWITQKCLAARCRPAPATVVNAVDLRGRLKSIFQPNGTYIQNLIMFSYALFSVQETMDGSLGYMASRIRAQLEEQITESQIEGFIRDFRAGSQLIDLFVGEPDSRFILITNWAKCKFFEVVDFGPAIIRPGLTPGKLTSHWVQTDEQRKVPGDVMVNLGRDSHGNYWIIGTLRSNSWQNIAVEFQEFNLARI